MFFVSIYQLKPKFQNLLRPVVGRLYSLGVTANQVTLLACALSVALGLVLYFLPVPRWTFGLIPAWMFVRMALNAIDGMLAREHGQQSNLGAFLNELTDVLSDAALILPFALVLPGDPFWVGLVIVLAGLSEFAGALGATVGATRRYDGPMGKSDRALVFGALGLMVALDFSMPGWVAWVMPIIVSLLVLTIIRRIGNALNQAKPEAESR